MRRTIPALLGFAFIAWVITQANKGSENLFFSIISFIPLGDKLGHMFLFGTLSFLSIIAFKYRNVKIEYYQVPIGALIVLFFSMTEELSQLFFINRSFDLMDAFADIIGIAISVLIANKYKVVLMKYIS
ncbi:MAG: VanZ family protein [Cognaticolwellia sp.]|jgi:VanZ family protein